METGGSSVRVCSSLISRLNKEGGEANANTMSQLHASATASVCVSTIAPNLLAARGVLKRESKVEIRLRLVPHNQRVYRSHADAQPTNGRQKKK
jgi:hypothetical protein